MVLKSEGLLSGKPGSVRPILWSVYFFITIMVGGGFYPQLLAQEVTRQTPPVAGGVNVRSAQLAEEVARQTPAVSSLPDGPEASSSSSVERYPAAVVIPGVDETTRVVIESSGPQQKVGSKFVLDGDVVITYGDRKVEADHIEYDTESGELVATGHLKVTGGRNNEIITASHGTLNVKAQTGRFYDVTGSVGLRQQPGQPGKTRLVYANSNPFLFTGKVVVKTGPQEYEVYGGTVTSCQLPHPDWLLYADKFKVNEEKATATNSVFKLLNVPLLYLPYVTHPVDEEGRQSGILLPVTGQTSTKGFVLGEQFYWAINRSMDAMLGVQYYSLRGWEQNGSFRYKGRGNDFATARFSALQDRGYTPTNGVYTNQGGQEIVFSGRHDFSAQTRVVADMDYLSSYVYREAFTENFNQAVSTDILSIAYGVHQANGYSYDVRVDRYQGLKRVPTPTVAGQQVRIFHAPSLDFDMTDHRVGETGLHWNLGASATGLKRVEPFFVSGGIAERLDVHPVVTYPLAWAGWKIRPLVGVRDTFYSRSKVPQPGFTVESTSPVNRSDVEVEVDVRPPAIERTFTSGVVRKVLHRDFRHTVEPAVTYRYRTGIGNFQKVLRFDDVDVVSDTNELEYGVTQRLFLRPGSTGKPCGTGQAAVDTESARLKDDGDVVPAPVTCGAREWISWRVAQKYFFDESFGGAVQSGRRNLLESTLNFSGIAFLTEPRAISPLVSRLQVRPTQKVDVEWDFDLDTGAKKFTSNNVLVDVRQGSVFGGVSYARLNAPGRSYTQGIPSVNSDFSQLRLLLGYGSPSKVGLGVAANAGLDLKLGSVQYGALQTSYNWNCCGLSLEYRKYALGSVRNENAYRFNFTLVNLGTAGNLRRAERLF